ncbi:MAG: putative Ig domain-containing protein, partial [Woeseiaceae bacterium]
GDGTATLAGTPTAANVGDHDVSLQVSDAALATATQDFTVTVTATPPVNNPPTFTSTAEVDATEGTTYTYEVTATDADAGATLAITAPTLPAWLELMDNGDGTATLTGTPAAADVGDHDVSLEVSDGTDTATQDFTITVAEATTPPPPPSGGGGGGGSLGFLTLFALGLVGAARTRRRPV